MWHSTKRSGNQTQPPWRSPSTPSHQGGVRRFLFSRYRIAAFWVSSRVRPASCPPPSSPARARRAIPDIPYDGWILRPPDVPFCLQRSGQRIKPVLGLSQNRIFKWKSKTAARHSSLSGWYFIYRESCSGSESAGLSGHNASSVKHNKRRVQFFFTTSGNHDGTRSGAAQLAGKPSDPQQEKRTHAPPDRRLPATAPPIYHRPCAPPVRNAHPRVGGAPGQQDQGAFSHARRSPAIAVHESGRTGATDDWCRPVPARNLTHSKSFLSAHKKTAPELGSGFELRR